MDIHFSIVDDFTTKIGVDNQSGAEFQTPTIFDRD